MDTKRNNSKLDALIEKVIDNPTEFYSKICDELTADERIFIIKHLQNKDCTSCTNGSCRIESYEKYGLDENGYPQGYNCIGWYNSELIGKSKVLQKLNIYELK